MSRHDYLNPDIQPKTIDEEFNQLGISADEKEKFFKHVEKTPLGNIVKGHRFRDGIGVRQDFVIAANYYAKAAHHGIPEGMYNLGQLHYHGRGVPRDYDMARHWFEKAAKGKPIVMVNFIG